MHLQNAFRSHTDSTHVLSSKWTNSLHVISRRSGSKTCSVPNAQENVDMRHMQVFVSVTPHLHCKRHDKTTRRDIIANKKERKKSTLHYLQLTSRARSSLAAASLPASSRCCLGVFKKTKNDDIHEANIRAQMITDLINYLDFIYRAKKTC